MLPPTLHLVTDRAVAPDLVTAVREALRDLPPAAAAVHVRDKSAGGAELLALARAVGGACRAAGQLFFVNDRVDVALASGADGVHLPAAGIGCSDARRLLGAGRFVGVSCHAPDEVARAASAGADYVTFSPIFDTPSKRAFGPPVGIEALRDAARCGLPVIALGGIEPANVRTVIEAGATGVAFIRAWLAAPDRAAAVPRLLALARA